MWEETGGQIDLNVEGRMLELDKERIWDGSAPGIKVHETGYGGGRDSGFGSLRGS